MGRYAWVRHLPPEDLEQFVAEIEETAKAGEDLAPMLAAWKATAEVHANPELREALLGAEPPGRRASCEPDES